MWYKVPATRTACKSKPMSPVLKFLIRRVASDPEAVAIWRAQIEVISDHERENFLKHRAGNLRQYLAGVEQICKQHGENSRAFKVARLMKPLFEMMNMYAPIA